MIPTGSSTGEIVLAAIGAAGMLIGIILIVLARRGRRLDDHPLCRKCRYDLTGRPEGSTRCAECGADLRDSNAIVIGNRGRRNRVLQGGLAVLAASLMMFGWGMFQIGSRIEWIQYMLLSWVMSDATNGSAGPRSRAINELARRVKLKVLSKSQNEALVDHLLTVHADQTITWLGWEALLDECIELGLFDDEGRLRKLITQMVDPALEIKPVLRRGQTLNIAFSTGSRRASQVLLVNGTIRGGPVQLAGREFFRSMDRKLDPGSPLVTNTGIFAFTPPWERFADLPDGEHEISVLCHVELKTQNPKAGRSTHSIVLDLPLKQKVRIVAADAAVDHFASDEQHRAAMQAAILGARVTEESGKVLLGLKIDRLPVPIAMEAWLVQGERRQRIGTIRVDPRQPGAWKKVYTRVSPEFRDGNIDVLLVPSQDAAADTRAIDTYWGDSITIPNVPVNAPYSPPLNFDETLRADVEKSIRISKIGPMANSPGRVGFTVDFQSAPVKLAYEVFIRVPGEPSLISVGRVWAPRRSNYGSGVSLLWPARFADLTKVDVVLRPDPLWEFNTFDLDPPWSGEVIVRDVPVDREARP